MAPESPVTYLSQGIDYLGFLNAKLRDLKGWATLANELIQNADDAEGATRVIFDVTNDALIVENNAQFSDCGAVSNDRCSDDPVGDGKKCCDFHAFRRVASGHKRLENDTTGAFGIGFISVYQITDRPLLRSGKWQWVMRPEALETKRIEAVPLESVFPATRFEFPWANTQTSLRTSLGIEPVSLDVVDRMCAELREALTRAAPFLKRLETLELRRGGTVNWVVRCERDPSAREIIVEAGGVTRLWKRVAAEFIQEANTLRNRYGASIEAKRKCNVTLAVPIDSLPEGGLLYAALPTEHDIALPVLINADFYPSSDRKRILFDQDFQGEWNRAAIHAAGQALAAALPELRELINPVDLWRLLQSAKELHRATASNMADKSFASFWNSLAPVVNSGQFIRIASNSWCSPGVARLLQSAKEEATILPLLEALGLKMVKLELQQFATLLRDKEVGVGYLTLDDLTNGLLKSGYDEVISIDQATEWLRSSEHRADLSQEFARLLDRVAKEAKAASREKVCRCAIVLTTKGTLAPANQLRRSNSSTRNLFDRIAPDNYWASDTNPPELLELVRAFTVRDAITLLRDTTNETLTSYNQTNPNWIVKVIGWFAENKSYLVGNNDLAKAIGALHIWPSGSELFPLDELSVPGGFDDRLKLARILDTDISTQWSSFLLDDLGARRMDLSTYLTEHVPRAFDSEHMPEFSTRRALMCVLVDHAGDLLDDRSAAIALRHLPIVECQDGRFHPPVGTYFGSELVSEVFGTTVPLAKLHSERQKATKDVLAWLGVSSLPRARDVLERVASLTENGPSQGQRDGIRSLFKGLAENWEGLADEQDDLEELQRIKWLPGNRSRGLLSPSELYSVFSRFLFETQAEFLDVPMPIQRVAADGLLRFLQIQSEPDVVLVVKHLLQLAQQGADVNMQVYEFLNRHAFDQKITLLKGKACLFPSDRRYVKGEICYWGAHSFGKYRVHLASDWRKYQSLLTQLGVSEQPTTKDAIQVLQEVSQDYADNRRLEDEDYQVVMSCWSLLSEDLESVPELADCLGELRVVPNSNHYLKKPSEIFIDDRPGLAEKFDEAISKMVIRRPEFAWRAMIAAGVQYLSTAVKVELVECVEPASDVEMAQLLSERWPLIRRVFAAVPNITVSLSAPPELWGSDQLKVSYRIINYPGPNEYVVAYLTETRSRIYFIRDRTSVWGAIARELAFGFYPDVGAGPLAAAIKEVLQSSNVDEARAVLDDLGFSEILLHSATQGNGDDAGLGVGAVEHDGSEGSAAAAGAEKQTGEEHLADGEGEPVVKEDDDMSGASEPGGNQRGDVQDDRTMRGPRTGGKSKDDHSKPGDRTMSREGRTFVGKSYLKSEGEDENTGMSDEAKNKRDNADKQGIIKVLEYETQKGRFPIEMPHENEGYDIESHDSNGHIVRYIEVKSLTGKWNDFGVKLSAPQFRMAQTMRDAYWLYVVEKSVGADAKIYCINDPASKVVEYRFDDGWQLVADAESPSLRKPLDAPSRPSESDSLLNEAEMGEGDSLLGEER